MRSRIPAPIMTLVAAGALALSASTTSAQAQEPRGTLVTHVNSCWSTDKVPPVIDSLQVTPTVVDADAGPVTVHLTVAAHDLGGPGPATGVGRVLVELGSPGVRGIEPSTLTRASDGTWQGTATLPGHTAATYAATVLAYDRATAHGTLSLDEESPSSRTFDPVVQSTTAQPPAVDSTPPTFMSLHLNKSTIDTRRRAQTLNVSVVASDAESGIGGVRADFHPHSGPGTEVVLRRVGTTDEFRGSRRILTRVGTHREGISVVFHDKAGNRTGITHTELHQLGFTGQLSIVSGPREHEGPRLVRVLQARGAVDIHHHGRWYRTRVLLTDPQGVATARAHLGHVGQVFLHLVSGSRRRGVWAGRVRVPRCLPSPETAELRISASDRLDVSHGTDVRRVHILSSDHRPPFARTTWTTTTPHPFTFSEPVHGISPSTVRAYDDAAAGDQDVVSGTWRCHGVHGHRVSCRAGSVLHATFFPDDPTAVVVAVYWEPGQHLDVLDAHGNPFATVNLDPRAID